MKKTKKQKN